MTVIFCPHTSHSGLSTSRREVLYLYSSSIGDQHVIIQAASVQVYRRNPRCIDKGSSESYPIFLLHLYIFTTTVVLPAKFRKFTGFLIFFTQLSRVGPKRRANFRFTALMVSVHDRLLSIFRFLMR